MSLSTDDAARLASLRAAYDKLISGKGVQEVRLPNGSVTRYGPGNVGVLQGEIAQLQALDASTTGRTRGAIRFRMGR